MRCFVWPFFFTHRAWEFLSNGWLDCDQVQETIRTEVTQWSRSYEYCATWIKVRCAHVIFLPLISNCWGWLWWVWWCVEGSGWARWEGTAGDRTNGMPQSPLWASLSIIMSDILLTHLRCFTLLILIRLLISTKKCSLKWKECVKVQVEAPVSLNDMTVVPSVMKVVLDRIDKEDVHMGWGATQGHEQDLKRDASKLSRNIAFLTDALMSRTPWTNKLSYPETKMSLNLFD